MIKFAVIQLSSEGSARDNLDRIAACAAAAAKESCSALCFPECSLTGYDPELAADKAISRDDPLLREISALAEAFCIDLLVGFMERDSSCFFLTHGVFRRDGSRDFYRKTHLGQKEARIFSPGDRLAVFPLSCGLSIGLQLCVETHFPEITQTLALKGAEVIFAPHAVPRAAGERQIIWGKYIPARSYDNRVYLACCNQWDDARFGGGCLVTDPRGEVIGASFENGPDLLTFEVAPGLVSRFHGDDSFPGGRYFPLHRRPELYADTAPKPEIS